MTESSQHPVVKNLPADLRSRVLSLTEKLVAIPSVVDTDGEARKAEFIYDFLSERLTGKDDVLLKITDVEKPTECKAVLGFIPAKTKTARTVGLMGHFDTVGYEPFRDLAEHALDYEKLAEVFSKSSDKRIAAHAASDDWRFGRGWMDMLGGVAICMELFVHEASERSLDANLLLLLVPDEESHSLGLKTLLLQLDELAQRSDLELLQIVNTDLQTEMKEDDDRRYIFGGTVGKALIGISVFGEPSHAGRPFAGLNAATMTAQLAAGIEQNRKLLAGIAGEWMAPPTVLHMQAERLRYDVTMPEYAELYFNLFHLGKATPFGWDDLLHEIRRIVKRSDREMRLRYNRFVAKSNQKPDRYKKLPEVIGFDTLLERAEEHTGKGSEELLAAAEANAGGAEHELRRRGLDMVRYIAGLIPQPRPLIVVSLLPPYYPAQVPLRGAAIEQSLKQLAKSTGHKYKSLYPYISDMSMFGVDADAMQEMGSKAPIWNAAEETGKLAKWNTPVCNIGPFGIGAHTAHERVYLPYMLDELPAIVWQAVVNAASLDT